MDSQPRGQDRSANEGVAVPAPRRPAHARTPHSARPVMLLAIRDAMSPAWQPTLAGRLAVEYAHGDLHLLRGARQQLRSAVLSSELSADISADTSRARALAALDSAIAELEVQVAADDTPVSDAPVSTGEPSSDDT